MVEFNIYPFSDLYEQGLIIKAKPYAFVFAHGNYRENIEISKQVNETHVESTFYFGKIHYTGYNHSSIQTEELITKLENEGYTYIWGTWCYQGDHDYVSQYLKQVTTYECIGGENNSCNILSRISKSDWIYHYADWSKSVNRAKKKGKIHPIWWGLGFVRL